LQLHTRILFWTEEEERKRKRLLGSALTSTISQKGGRRADHTEKDRNGQSKTSTGSKAAYSTVGDSGRAGRQARLNEDTCCGNLVQPSHSSSERITARYAWDGGGGRDERPSPLRFTPPPPPLYPTQAGTTRTPPLRRAPRAWRLHGGGRSEPFCAPTYPHLLCCKL